MKFLLLGFNNGDNNFNRALQSFQDNRHPAVDSFFEQFQGSPHNFITPEEVGVTRWPSLVIMALTGRKPNGEKCFKRVYNFEGAGITRERIVQVIERLALFPLPADTSCTGGYLPGGEGEGSEGYPGLFGLGPWLLIAGMAVFTVKTLNANKRSGKIVYGSLAALAAARYFSLPADQRKLINGIGAPQQTLWLQ